MSTATLDVWITAVGEPCKIDTEHKWFVHVLHCDGTVLDWCGRHYQNIPTECGHAEIPVPPGQYLVVATWSPGAPSTTPSSLGNHISHLQVVRVDCGETACVTLFPPTFHWCGIWWLVAARTHAAMKTVDAEAVEAAARAMQRVTGDLPVDELTERMMVLAEQPRAQRKQRPKK